MCGHGLRGLEPDLDAAACGQRRAQDLAQLAAVREDVAAVRNDVRALAAEMRESMRQLVLGMKA